MSSILSQEEINALLDETFANSPSDKEEGQDILTSMEADTLGEIFNISMGSAATALSSLLGKRVEITTPNVEMVNLEEVIASYENEHVIIDVNYNQGLVGSNILIMKVYDASVIVDLMMGSDGTNPPTELSDLHLSAVSEAMNQMMGSSSTSLSQILSKRIDISPPALDLQNLKDYDFHLEDAGHIVKMSFHVTIKDLVDSEMMQLVPLTFAKTMVADLMAANGLSSAPAPKKSSKKEKAAAAQPEAVPGMQEPPQAYDIPAPREAEPKKDKVMVSPVEYQKFAPEPIYASAQPNLELIMDVGLQLSVELGRTHKRIKEILDLAQGSILELDKLAGEPVDILINGKLLAKGEVVVIDEKFGVRVTEIISPLERVRKLG